MEKWKSKEVEKWKRKILGQMYALPNQLDLLTIEELTCQNESTRRTYLTKLRAHATDDVTSQQVRRPSVHRE